MTIGQRIQDARKKANFTQKKLAEACGLATGTIQQYELDKRQPRLVQLKSIASALNISVAELLGDENSFYTAAQNRNTLSVEVTYKKPLTEQEHDHIQKYRALDERGKGTVDTVLDWEYRQVREPKKQDD